MLSGTVIETKLTHTVYLLLPNDVLELPKTPPPTDQENTN